MIYDSAISSLKSLFAAKGGLLVFIFHQLYKSKAECSSKLLSPCQPILVEHFRTFIEYYLEKGHKFISPADILTGLKANRKYVLITFDDGYFNNINTLPLLNEYKVPAVFFVTVNNVKWNEAFWVDALYRERTRRGTSEDSILAEKQSMYAMTADEIRSYLLKDFGGGALASLGDADRPFSEEELKSFSKEGFVTIGNHCMDHTALTNYSADGVRRQVGEAQDELLRITGEKPVMISYPFGRSSDEVVQISKACELRLGVTVRKGVNRLPLKEPLKIRRLALDPGHDIKKQCEDVTLLKVKV
jgi:peptidoglycan/xylan/chitin deacetylase (PgdA/CDA1 family)